MRAGRRGAQSCSQLVIEERQLQIVRSGVNIVLNPKTLFNYVLLSLVTEARLGVYGFM